MADGLSVPLSSAEQIQANYKKYKDKFKDATAELVNSETFLNLLVAEMTNQDPLEPTSNTEFVTQMAQFSSLQYTKDSASYAKSNYASSLVGKTVTAQKMDGAELVTRTGVVSSVTKTADSFNITIDGVAFDISKVISVSDTAGGNNGVSGGNSLGELITRASMMIGMNVSLSTVADNVPAEISGIVASVKVKDGQVMVVVDNNEYPLESITSVAYPEIAQPQAPENTEQTPQAEQGISVEEQIAEAVQKMADSNAEALMEAIDRMNNRQDEDIRESDENIADDFVDEDISDLEDLI